MYYYGCWPHYHFTQNIVGSIAQKKKKKKKKWAQHLLKLRPAERYWQNNFSKYFKEIYFLATQPEFILKKRKRNIQ